MQKFFIAPKEMAAAKPQVVIVLFMRLPVVSVVFIYMMLSNRCAANNRFYIEDFYQCVCVVGIGFKMFPSSNSYVCYTVVLQEPERVLNAH